LATALKKQVRLGWGMEGAELAASPARHRQKKTNSEELVCDVWHLWGR